MALEGRIKENGEIKFAFYSGTCYSKTHRNRDLNSQNGKGYHFEVNPAFLWIFYSYE